MKANIKTFALYLMILLSIGGFLAYYLGRKHAKDQEKEFKLLIANKVAECCVGGIKEIGDLYFKKPYDYGKVYVECLNDSVTFYLDSKISVNAKIISIIVPDCGSESISLFQSIN